MMVRQPMEYASVIWDPHHQTEIDKIEKVQRRAARFVQGDYKYTSSVTAMLEKLKWTSLEQRRKNKRVKFLANILSNKVAVNKHLLIPAKERTRRTHKYQLELITSKRDYRKYSFFPRTVRDWNALPPDSVPADVGLFFGIRQ